MEFGVRVKGRLGAVYLWLVAKGCVYKSQLKCVLPQTYIFYCSTDFYCK